MVTLSVGWYKGCGFDYWWRCDTATGPCTHVHDFLDKTWHLHHSKICVWNNSHKNIVVRSPWDSISRPPDSESIVITTELSCIFWRRSHFEFHKDLGLFISTTHYRSKRFFSIFETLMSTWRDSICENTFKTLNVRFIHENVSVLITIPLDQIQQNLLRKETYQATAKPADVVLETWFEEYPTPP